jgi:hypothetical protein
MLVILALGGLRQEDHKFKASLGCIARLFQDSNNNNNKNPMNLSKHLFQSNACLFETLYKGKHRHTAPLCSLEQESYLSDLSLSVRGKITLLISKGQVQP